MGNVSYISFNRAVSDDQFTEMLTTVTEKHFPLYEVGFSPNPGGAFGPCWLFKLKDGVLTTDDGYDPKLLENGSAQGYWSLFIWRASNYSKKTNGVYPFYKGKFEHEIGGGYWRYWLADQLHGRFTEEYKSWSGADSVAGTWKIDPKKYPTYIDSAKDRFLRFQRPLPPAFFEKVESEIPVGLRGMKG